ncbi:MAG TPA: hypothetical protein VIY90_00220 [Steroidobacteraceae bacterium]
MRAGVAPRFAGRYVIELREHLADLTERDHKAGLDATAARERARELLGTDAQLTQAMLDTAPRTLAARAPWAVLGVLPAVVLVAVIWAIDDSMIRLFEPLQPGGVLNTYVGTIAAASFVTSYVLGPAFASACIFIALRQRLSSQWVWIGLGVIALASSFFGFHMNVRPPLGGHPGDTTFSAMPIVYVAGHVSTAATLSRAVMRATVLFSIAAIALRWLRNRFTDPRAAAG